MKENPLVFAIIKGIEKEIIMSREKRPDIRNDAGIGVGIKELTMSKALWISRHEATVVQLVELSARGETLVALEKGILLGNRNLATDEDVDAFITTLHALILEEGAEAVYGVFAAPVQNRLVQETSEIYERRGEGLDDETVPCFSAWNVSRTVEGGKATFEHKRFVWAGDIFNNPLN